MTDATDGGGARTSGSAPRLYQRAFDILSGQIRSGEIVAGSELFETGVAALFGISRAPARRALAELEDAGLLERATGRGYRVKPGSGRAASPASQQAEIVDDLRLVSTSSWERIYGEVEGEIAARIAFDRWRVNEAELARYYGVSRTVARDVIGRLQQRGVVRKDERSRWYAPALTPDHVGELYELRWLLEPVALAKAATRLPPGLLSEVRARLATAMDHPDRIDGATLDALEKDLHVTLLGHCGSAALMQAITLPHSLLIAHRFLYGWSPRLFDTEPFLPEHAAIFDHLDSGRVAKAARALEAHLKVSLDRARARIEVISRSHEPAPLPYLDRS
jgi:DNA-binding GntR family transcriptional regulator